MSINMKIFQLYYKPEQEIQLDPAFVPVNNVENPRPELREWYIWDRDYKKCCDEGLDLWGWVSWKFREKTNLTGKQVIDHIKSNLGYDVYLFNPCIANEALFANSWEQGDIHHPNISEIGNTFIKKLGYEDIDVRELLLDRNCTVFANYVVGNRKFWDGFMEFSRRLFTEAEKDLEFKHQVFGEGLSNYAHDKSLPNFTFLIERLIPTYIDLNDLKSCPYTHTQQTAAAKYQKNIGDILSLSDLKMQVNKYQSDELYRIWNYHRLKCLHDNPTILGLE